jgi:hypothetical protein
MLQCLICHFLPDFRGSKHTPNFRAVCDLIDADVIPSPWGCLVHFAKLCKDVKRAFEVLNEVYLQNFLHRWVVNRETNLMMLINPCLINN